VAKGDHDFPAVGVADHGALEQVARASGDLLEPSLGGECLGDVGEEVRLGPGRLVCTERGALKRGLGAKGLGHQISS
jgi:hypothetical protein